MLSIKIARVRFLQQTNLRTDYQHSVAISLLRGLAALQVAAAHVRAQFYPGLSTIADPSAGYQALAFFTGFAHQAVVIFFLLSGWLVGGSLMNKLNEPHAMLSYAIDRITRLWIVLAPAFVASLLIGVAIGALSPPGGGDGIPEEYTLATFVGNLFGLQDLAVPRYGGNFALWSLTYETWYYVLFPLAVLMFARQGGWAKASAAVAVTVIAWHLNAAILLYFTLWLLGAGCSRIQVDASPMAKWTLAGVFVLVATWFRLKGSNDILVEESYLQDLLYSLLFLALLCSLQSKVGPADRLVLRLGRIGSFFAEFSFSLYVIHVPLIFLVRHINKSQLGIERLDPASLSDFGLYTSIVVLIVLLAWLFHLPFEAQTYRVRRRLKEWMLPRAQPQNIA
ncbi:acyltransferase family protein [Massilia sp. GCM10020059]|uniref:Acyltransferase n=1 Tax=Massilia agrisoli TaxID=2892444 RepID=A0ABS8IXU6_9BURK|nr:acyltransferase [Massilia agrisoli]MCC6072010.1 acyltransferase [Massilia agrisoli]